MKNLAYSILALVAAVWIATVASPASAQVATVVSSCGALNIPTGYAQAPLVQDQTGTLCAHGSGTTPPANFSPSQVSVTTATGPATLLSASRTARQLITVVNTTTTAVYLGGSGVTTSTGALLPGVVGASITIPYTGALYGIVASGTATVTVTELY